MHAASIFRSPDVSASPVGNRLVLYHRISRAAVVLNPTGSLMWERLASPCGAGDLVAELCARYPSLTTADAERDVAAFLDGLAAHALITQPS